MWELNRCGDRTPMQTLASVIVLACGLVPMAHGIPCIVESTNHGGGLFSYTFRRGDDLYVWGLGTNFGTVYLQSYGVVEVQEPLGWTHSISPSGQITWTVTNGVAFLDEPVTFTVRSCLTESAIYPPDASVSAISSVVFALPERIQILGGGYQAFDWIGPARPSFTIERTNTVVVVRWSAQALGLQLEACDSLDSSGLWTSVTNVPTLVDSKFTVMLPAIASTRFFRLATPCTQSPDN